MSVIAWYVSLCIVQHTKRLALAALLLLEAAVDAKPLDGAAVVQELDALRAGVAEPTVLGLVDGRGHHLHVIDVEDLALPWAAHGEHQVDLLRFQHLVQAGKIEAVLF